jgi:hypothetical protein
VNSDFLQGENSRSSIGRRQRFCIISFLEALLLENLFCSLGVVFGDGWSVVVAASVSSPRRGLSFLFLPFFIFLLAVCSLVVVRRLVGAEAGCNWHLRDFNIFPLLENM